jgi:hypothetical protein
VTLDAATERPHGDLGFVAYPQENGFNLFLDVRGWGEPEFLEVDLRGQRRQRLAVFWNGLAYLQ